MRTCRTRIFAKFSSPSTLTETIAQIVARAVILAMADLTTFRTVSTFRAQSLAMDAAVTGVTEALARHRIARFRRPFLALARLFAIQTESTFRTGGIARVVFKSGATRTLA